MSSIRIWFDRSPLEYRLELSKGLVAYLLAYKYKHKHYRVVFILVYCIYTLKKSKIFLLDKKLQIQQDLYDNVCQSNITPYRADAHER